MVLIQLSLKSRPFCRIAQKYFIRVYTKYLDCNICVKTEDVTTESRFFLKLSYDQIRLSGLIGPSSGKKQTSITIVLKFSIVRTKSDEKLKKNGNEFSDCESSFRSIRGFSDFVKSRRSGRSSVYRRSRSGSIQNL